MEAFVLLFGYLAFTATVHGYDDQSGFISIDCGIHPGSNYFDATTEIYHVSDLEFIDTGKNYYVAKEHSPLFETAFQQLMTVRSFPDGSKNCYTVRLQKDKDHKYLIRASFMYGNYDSKDQLPVFKLYLGVDEWDIVKFNNSFDVVRKEIIHVPMSDHIDVCLVNIGSGSPFISSLELRRLNSSIYTTQIGSLILFRRFDIGSTRNQTVRYSDDAFDRLWEPFVDPYWKSVSSSYGGDPLSDNHFKIPSEVMATAVTPANEGDSLEFHLNLGNSTRQFYAYLHFFEVEDLQFNQLREFYVSINGLFLTHEPIILGRSVPHSGFSANFITTSSELSLSIHKTSRSTLPPILNALEVYEIKQLSHSSTFWNDVDAVKKIKMVYKVKKNWQGDPCLPIEFSWDGLSCSYTNSFSPTIVSMNISWSKLTGEIDSSLLNLTSLECLDLSYNSLTGEVPTFLSGLPSLKILNLSGNNLTGSVPLALLEKSMRGSLSLRLDENPYLCKKFFCEDVEEENKEKMKNNVIIPALASIISVLVILVGDWTLKRRKRHDGLLDSKKSHISYSEVGRITENFKKLLYQGASVKVYLGHLSDGTEVAVKMLTPSSVLVFKQFNTEVEMLTRVHHRNLVSLIGYCDEGSNMVLVYEHMAKGNLKDYISGEKQVVLSWEQRLQIAIDAARALDYLHDGFNPPIIHGDFTTESIFLDENFEAKVADFGWPRSMPSEGESNSSTSIVGRPGYVDPEYYRTSVPSKETDVYSFGIVLLELISGLPAIIKFTENSRYNIADWAHLLTVNGYVKMIIDPNLQGEYKAISLQRAVTTAMSCVSLSTTERPTMSQILVELNECLKLAKAHRRTECAEKNGDPVNIDAAHERTNDAEEDHDPFGSEAACERTDFINAEVGHNPLSVEAAYKSDGKGKEVQCYIGSGAAHERQDNGNEDHCSGCIAAAIINDALENQGPFGIEAAPKRNENGGEEKIPSGIGAAHERHANGKEDHGPLGIAAACEITDDAEEGQRPVGIDTTKERPPNIDDNQGAVSIGVAHERNDTGQEDHCGIDATKERTPNIDDNQGTVSIGVAPERNGTGQEDHCPVGIETAHERTGIVEEDHDHLGTNVAVDIEKSTNLYDGTKEERKEKNVAIPAVESVSLGVIPPDNVVKNTFEPKNRCFSYSDIERITDNFGKELGRGASATVYHGCLSDGIEVAVKKLSPSSTLGLKQFKTEAELLTRVHHKNLVSLFGYCEEGSNMVLVYEFMAMGNLKEYLSGKRESVLSWEQRLRIAVDAAQALDYLHNGCYPPIIHRDVKTENILLNEKLQAKMADFGWSKSMPADGGSYVSTAIVGTPGYLDPEYYRNSVPNEKSDVYSFGIVLLELISSRPAIIKNTKDGPCNISNWVRPIIANGDISMIVDPRLQGGFEINSARKAIGTAMSCVSFSSTDRPTTSDMVIELRECLKMAKERTKFFEEGSTSVGIGAAISVQGSLDGTQGTLNSAYNVEAAEREKEKLEKKMKKKKKNFFGPAVATITSALVPSGALISLGKAKRKWPAKDMNYLEAPRMSYSELVRITHNFQQLIGEGVFGSVYRGHLSNGTEVAVKMYSNSRLESGQGCTLFTSEAEVLSKVNNKNLVSLLGFCYEDSAAGLVYEYMANGSLTENLFDHRKAVLSWKQRIGIALDVAQGLEYLHYGCRHCIIHGDIKLSNILLNKNLEAKLTGFVICRSLLDEDRHDTDRICGTFQYMAPEYAVHGEVSVKTDVYSFGIVMLELVSGQKFYDFYEQPDALREWVKSRLNGDRAEIGCIVDPRLNGNVDINSATTVVETAIACIRESPSKRPTMRIAAYILKECLLSLARTTGDLELDLGSLLGPLDPLEHVRGLFYFPPKPLEEGTGSVISEDSTILEGR